MQSQVVNRNLNSVADFEDAWKEVQEKHHNAYYLPKGNERKQAMLIAQKEEARLNDEFRMFLENDHGVSTHKNAKKLFELSWSAGHSGGYQEIANYYNEFVELLK